MPGPTDEPYQAPAPAAASLARSTLLLFILGGAYIAFRIIQIVWQVAAFAIDVL